MSKKVLFLCQGNSARSQIAEALLNKKGDNKFIAYSAGTNPAKAINPLAVQAVSRLGIDISDRRPKSVAEFANEEFDFVITLCEKGKEQCINQIGMPIYADWSFPDPAGFYGTEEEKIGQFDDLVKQIIMRINLFISIPMEKLDRRALEMKTQEIGNIPCECNNSKKG